jgi:hypothetical protein
MIGSEGGMPGPHRASAMGTRVASQREVARRLGISHTALQKAQRSGRIAPEPDGSWDVEKVRAQLARTANTGAATLGGDGLGAVAIRKGDGSVHLDPGDLPASALVTVLHDGTPSALPDPRPPRRLPAPPARL